jgi:chromosome segregation and condensation protein ScpB
MRCHNLPCLFAVLLCQAGLLNAADRVVFSNGTALECQVLKHMPGDDEIIVNTGAKIETLQRKDLDAVTIDVDAREEFRKRLNAIKSNDAKGHFELAQWARAQRLFTLAEAELHATLAADPTHDQAHQTLGHVFKDGRWLELVELEQPAANSGDEITIGRNPKMSPAWQERITFYNGALDVCKKFADGADSKARNDALKEFLAKDPRRATEGLLGCMVPCTTPEAKMRLAALKVVEASQLAHPMVSAYLAGSAIRDPEKDVRKAAISTIKARKDDQAIGRIINTLLATYSESGAILDAAANGNAVAALTDLDDRRVYSALNYYVTLEVRATMVDLANFTTRQIDSYTVNSGTVTVIVPLSFPIQFPELKITRVRTTVKCPASLALEAITGQAFGMDAERWAKWIERH